MTIAALAVILACILVSGCVLGPSYKMRDGPRLTRAEKAPFHYDNDLEYVCDRDKLGREVQAEIRRLEELLQSKPHYLFRMQVGSSDEPGDLDRDVTVREFAVQGGRVLREKASRGGHNARCFQRHARRLARAIATSR